MPTAQPQSDFRDLSRLLRAYQRRWGVCACAIDLAGDVVAGRSPTRAAGAHAWRQAMLHALSEGLRWGEPAILDRPEGHLLWAVPLMVNSRTHGGLLAYARVSDVSHDGTFEKRIDLRRACTALREMAEAGNLTNAAHLARARAEAEREQRRAEAIHEMKLNESTGSWRSICARSRSS